jgi:PBP1b-binding outer membrane lipoprotein LpoB
MKTIQQVMTLALLASAMLISGCDKEEKTPVAATTQATSPTTSEKAAPAKSAEKTLEKITEKSTPWEDLSALQKSVLSIGETVWPTIPAEKQKYFMSTAENWSKTQAADQKKMLDELRSYTKK